MSPESYTAVATGVVALAALVVAVWQGFLTRKHNRLSVKPLLRFDCYAARGPIEIVLTNKGTGPAILKSLTIQVGSTVVGGDRHDRIQSALRLAGIRNRCRCYTPEDDEVFAANEPKTLMAFTEFTDADDRRAVMDALCNFTFRASFVSIYREEQFETYTPLLAKASANIIIDSTPDSKGEKRPSRSPGGA